MAPGMMAPGMMRRNDDDKQQERTSDADVAGRQEPFGAFPARQQQQPFGELVMMQRDEEPNSGKEIFPVQQQQRQQSGGRTGHSAHGDRLPPMRAEGNDDDKR